MLALIIIQVYIFLLYPNWKFTQFLLRRLLKGNLCSNNHKYSDTQEFPNKTTDNGKNSQTNQTKSVKTAGTEK